MHFCGMLIFPIYLKEINVIFLRFCEEYAIIKAKIMKR